jgi:CheY-like chemotaxis protein
MTTQPKVLLVDDNHEVRLVIRDTLIELGYAVRTAKNGKSALQRLGDHRFSAALIDFMMHPMDGAELAQRAVALQPDIKIIIMSGYDRETLRGRISDRTVFLPKPFSRSMLVQCLKTAQDAQAI